MTVETVGEMVHGHTFQSLSVDVTDGTPCDQFADGATDNSQRCGRPYNEHMLRPPLPLRTLDSAPNSVGPTGFMDRHKYGCAQVVEYGPAPCNCGFVTWNLGQLMFLADRGLLGYEANLRPGVGPVYEMASTEFRTAYASLEATTDVTVNGRVIGRWSPAKG